MVGVLLSEIMPRKDYKNTMRICQKASASIKKDQRELQKEVVRNRQSQEHEADDDEEVEEPFICPMCFHVLLGPVTLPCGHTLCKGCVESWKAACGPCFKSPCCNQVVPYKLKERKGMSKDIEMLYPKQLSTRAQELAQPVAEGSEEACIQTVSSTVSIDEPTPI